MPDLNNNPAIHELAGKLGISPKEGNLVRALTDLALGRVNSLVEGFPLSSLDELRMLVGNRLSLKVEMVRADDDLERMVKDHDNGFPGLADLLQSEFGSRGTEGLLLQRPDPPEGSHRYLAIVDARNEFASRAYFTSWHEIAHLLLLPVGEELPLVRRTPGAHGPSKDPEEQLVDIVAGKLAFHSMLFQPVIEEAISRHGGLTFEAVEEARAKASPSASLYATAIASLPYSAAPLLLVRVDRTYKKAEERELMQGRIFGKPPVPKLRLKDWIRSHRSMPIEIGKNMRVPRGSVLREVYDGDYDTHMVRVENQSDWETTQAGSLPPLALRVEAIRRGRFVYGLVQKA